MTLAYFAGLLITGTSADRTGGTWTNLPAGWKFLETDTYTTYYWNGSSWNITNSTRNQATVLLFKSGSTYYAMKHDGTVISSSSTAETVIAAALTQEGTLYFSNTEVDGSGATTDWLLSGAFTGFTITGDTTIVADSHQVRWVVPQGFSGVCLTIDGATDEDVNIFGLSIREGGTPTNDWTGIKLQMNGASDYAYFQKYRDINIVNPNIGIELETANASAFITSCAFENIMIWHPDTAGILFDETPGGQISQNLFKDVNIQTDSNFSHGFKNVSGNGNMFINCAVWDEPLASVCMNIDTTAIDTIVIGGRIGRSGAFIDRGFQTRKMLTMVRGVKDSVFTLPDSGKYGAWFGIANGTSEGIMNGKISTLAVGTGSTANALDSTGNYIQYITGATNNSLSGIYQNLVTYRRSLDVYFKSGIYLENNTNMRVFTGLVASASAPASSADPLNALEGIGLWFDSGVSANWKIMHNDTSGASAVDDTGIAAATSTLFIPEIYAHEDTRFRVIFSGVATEVSTNIPASSTNLSWRTYIENTTGSSRIIRAYYIITRSDK